MQKEFTPSVKNFLLCLLFDAMGFITLAFPVAGELLHLIWAPISTLVFFRMHGGKFGIIGGAFSYLEESQPRMHFIPTFTISWLLMYKVASRSKLHQLSSNA